MNRALRLFVATLLILALPGSPGRAFAPAKSGALSGLNRSLPWVVPVQDETMRARLAATHPGVAPLVREAGGPWQVDFDLTTGRLRRALGTGIPLIPGPANALPRGASERSLVELEAIGRAFLARHADLFSIDPAEWQLEPGASQAIDGGAVQPIFFRRSIGGVPVAYAQIQLVLNRGNLTYINATGMEAVTASPLPALDESETWAVIAGETAAIGIGLDDAERLGKPELQLVPVQATPGGPVSYRLLRYHDFRLAPGLETWRGGVDAHSGELVEFEDTNRYACSLDPTRLQGVVRGGVRAAQATDPETTINFIYPRVTDGGNTVNGDSNGYFFYSGQPASCAMQGQYFAVNCTGCTPNPPLVSTQTDGILDFGTGGVDSTSNGRSTPADRTSYYHLNYARAIAAKWITRPWLDASVGDNVNIAQTCNAFWNGSSVNFFRSGGQCTNTGEIRDVMQHEWGHGMDSNDGVSPVDGAMGEAYGDYIALFVDHDSCIGQSFFSSPANSSGPYCTTIPGCGGTLPPCTGVRNTDEKRSTSGLMSMNTAPNNCGGGSGPLGLEVHCEGEIFGQAAFHLAMNFLTGVDYNSGVALPGANPAYSDTAAWFIHEHIFFGAAQLMGSYAPSHRQSRGTGSYDAFLTVDDNDGNLANGTPNAAYVNAAFQHHNMEELTLISDSANCTPPPDPVFTLTPLFDPTSGNAQIKVSWADQNAAFYVVYRSLRPTDAWLPVRNQIQDDGGPTYDVYDEPIQIGQTYYYTVVAVTTSGPQNSPCVSPGSGVRSQVVALPDATASIGQVTDPAPGGDNDGIPEPGERVRIRVDLREVANLVGLTNTTVVLSTSDPLAQVTVAGPISYGTVAAGQTVNGPSTFEVGIASAHACGTFVPLVASITADNACMLRALSIAIPTAGCVPAPRGEASPTALSVTSDAIDPACTDNDVVLDNGETASLDVTVRNAGGAAANAVTVQLVSQSPNVTVVSTNPVIIPTLAAGATTTATFSIQAQGASCQADAVLQATVNSNENLFPISRSQTIRLEEDLAAVSLNTGFETDFGLWTATEFTRDNRRTNGGAFAAFGGPPAGSTPTCATSPGQGANACGVLLSPPFVPGVASTLTFANWYQLEPLGGGQHWDRANVHVVENGVHTLISPVAGKLYVGTVGPPAGLCHIGSENGWADCTGNTWGTSQFDISSYAGREIQLEINYNSDGSDIGEGIYVDDVVVTGARARSCDASSCSVNQPVLDVTICDGTELCVSSGVSDGIIDPGDEVTYRITIANSGSGAAADVQGTVVATGGTVLSGAAIGGTPPVDIPIGGSYVHTAVVRVDAACGIALDVNVNNLRAGSTVFTPNQTRCDRTIGSSQPARTAVFRDTVAQPIPDWPAGSIQHTLTSTVPVAVTTATLAITTDHSRPSELAALLRGPRGTTLVANPALNATLDVTGLVNADGAGDYVLSLEDTQVGRRGSLIEWSLTLDVPAFSLCTACVPGSCAAPVLSVTASDPTPCAGRFIALTPNFTNPGAGSFDYEWDFGDGSAPFTVTNPFVAVTYRYSSPPTSYTATLRAVSRQSGTCNASGSTVINIDPGTPPSGNVGNQLQLVRSGDGALLDWNGAVVSPPQFNLHKTYVAAELADTAGGIGDEPVLARPTVPSFLDPFVVLTQPDLAFYEVFAANTCGVTLLTP